MQLFAHLVKIHIQQDVLTGYRLVYLMKLLLLLMRITMNMDHLNHILKQIIMIKQLKHNQQILFIDMSFQII